MTFVIAAIFILVISFVVALISLVREQSKIEKENTVFGKNQDQQEVKTPKITNENMQQADLMNIDTVQPQPPSPLQPQPQPAVPSPDYNTISLKEKPWWESEIQKREEEPPGHAIDWQNINQVQRKPKADVLKIEESAEVSESGERALEQAQKEQGQNLQGSFSVSEIAKGDQES
ncbi:hypothetical protein A2W45_02140 [Candidatus Curtissbacteria bacterium RIFCSPHIGHO2_12_41_11]|uniref:Uncharacterized protein n=1 Tax=Candidatus Curtissbacteria bacterium RIFCSPHIGHO2_12_41_11 TaxID=1797718 RepID=A0A1F5H3L0_9BACT|nr:MAG: hypothetical protein A2W45_02140 [Candidatus Curtissbacteria bacterium RIFCSPHIGHO2_12_41_11]HLA03894.1 hypothetical protein [Patescibacteria group bacterium]